MKKKLNILYAEDDSITRFFIKYRLAAVYEEVLEASDGAECLAMYKAKRPDVLITDMSMPVMGGRELVENVLQIYPAQKVIMLSGDCGGEPFPGCIVVMKPVIMKELCRIIDELAEGCG